MASNRNSAEHYRQLARLARNDAGRSSSAEAKSVLLRLAEDYEALAEAIERDAQP